MYSEKQTKTTDRFGLVPLQVGQGTVVQGNFAAINWGNGAAMIRVKVNGVVLPESPILPVPLALYALKSGGNAADSWTSSGANIYRADGYVGIGIQNPTSKLHVNGNLTLLGDNNWVYHMFSNQNRTKYFELSPGGDFYLYDKNSQFYNMIFRANGDANIGNAMTLVKSNGNVGIGTSTPQKKLDVTGQIQSIAAWPAYYWTRENGTAAYSMDLNPNTSDLSIFNQIQGKTILIIRQDGTVSVPVLEVRGADIVEKFKSKETIEAGMIVTIDENDIKNYKTTNKAYQKGVVGIVSGANGVKHGMLLEQDDALAGNTKVAIAGRVYVKATSQNGAIKAGDFITSSDKAGYAMKSTNRHKAYGSVIGKALTSLEKGEGYVLVLVGLQ